MKTIKKTLNILHYYHIFKFLILGSVFLILAPVTAQLVSGFFFSNTFKILKGPAETVIKICFVAIWLYIIFLDFQDIIYYERTGRKHYLNDKSKFGRNWYQLIEYFKDSDPHKLKATNFKIENWRESSGIFFGIADKHLIKLPSNAEANIAVFGTPGSKKTSGIAIPSASRFEGSVFAIDIKGDIYNYNNSHRKIIRFCPDDENALSISAHFNPFEEMSFMNETKRKLYIENMAVTLVPDESGSNGNYFSSTARDILQGIIHYMFYNNPDITFPDVMHAILHPSSESGLPTSIFEWITQIIDSDCNLAKERVASLYGNNEKNISGGFNCLAKALVPLTNEILDQLLVPSTDDCSVNIATLEAGYDIYLQIEQENLSVYAPLFTLITQSIMSGFTKRPDNSTGAKNRTILMLLDEFPQLTFSLNQINMALSTLRSKSIICMLLAQNTAQLERKYGEAGSRSILGNCTYQLILSCIDGKSQRYFSDLIGTKKVLVVNNNENSGTNIYNGTTGKNCVETREPIYRPEDFGDLGNHLIIYYNGKHIKATKISCYEK